MKKLFFCLFLYVCLICVLALYLNQGHPEDAWSFGLLWIVIGVGAVLVFIVGAWLWGWWRNWRAKAAERPAAQPKPAQVVHEDDAALAALIAEANATLAKSPAYAGKPGRTPLSELPLYLLIGPEGSGKTSTFLNSGLEPHLLAGQVTGATRLCNIWLARNAVFAEISGRAFSGDIGRWTQLLKVLRGGASLPLWRRLWREPDPGLALHGVIGCCDVKEFTGASNPPRIERCGHDWQERLRAIGEVFGVNFPVYQVITKCDAIPFFSDYFRRLPEPEANQVLGCTLPFRETNAASTADVSVDAQIKRLTKSFSPLYYALAKRRITHLAHEPDPARRPGIYEFPRELKRLRSPLVQFLTDVFRPHPLQPGQLLRGYYLTGTREVEVAPAADHGASRADWSIPNLGTEATRLFSGDATQIFRPANAAKMQNAGGRGGLATRWMFVADLFQSVILGDQPAQNPVPADPKLELYRRAAFAVVYGVCILLCFAFLWSWTENNKLLGEVEHAGTAEPLKPYKLETFAQLQSLEDFRAQVARLAMYDRNRPPIGSRWFLYSGSRVLPAAKASYFRHFQQLVLNDLNEMMVVRLANAPANPGPNDPYDRIYRVLKTHLMISSGASCPAEPAYAARALKETREEVPTLAGLERQALVERQIDFYASELAGGNPCPVRFDAAARDRARQYLSQIKGVERIYSGILVNAEKTLAKPQRLADLAPNYTQVLTGPAEPGGAFTPEGWTFVQKASKENTGAPGEACVTGGGSALVTAWTDKTAQQIQNLFIRDYIEQWRKFVAGFSVLPYRTPDDAAKKLDVLAGQKSPLLALLAMTAKHTYFQSAPAEQSVIEKGLEKGQNALSSLLKKAEKKGDQMGLALTSPTDRMSSPSDIARTFQPVHWVVPPASDKWVVDSNNAYIDSLARLRQSMQDIASGGANADPAVHQMANQNYEKALDAVRQIAKGFKPEGVAGLDATTQRLLEEPIRLSKRFIIDDPGKATIGKANGDLRKFCGGFRSALGKFPFRASGSDLTLDELNKWFAPGGEIWQFQAKSLGELTVKDGSRWKAKDETKKPQVTLDILNFLNKSQMIADAFYPAGATKPRLTYTLRPRLDSSFGSSTLELEVDGQLHLWTSSLQHQFTWPAPVGANNPGAIARIRGTVAYAFANRSGLWGIFRIMADAEPRQLDSKLVEWKYSRVGDGRPDPIQPAPVRVDIVEFPGGKDLFNPKFFEGFQCPAIAVQ